MADAKKITNAEINKIVALYGIDLVDYTLIDGGNANLNYQLTTKEDKYILTIAEEKSFEEVESLARLLVYFETHHFTSSQIQTTTKGELVVKTIGKPMFLKKWISGAVCQNLTKTMLQELGKALAELHQIPVPNFLAKSHAYGLQLFPRIFNKGIDLEYEEWIKERFNYLEKNIPQNLPKGLVHGDLFFDNVLFENNKLKAIIDFEEACHYFLVFDLGMSIVGLCSHQEKINWTKAGDLIKGYEQIRSLETLEKESLMLFAEYAAIATSFWRYNKYNILSPEPSLKNKHWEMVNIANEIRAHSKTQFL